MKENEFQCAKCSGIFEKGWSDEAAKEEAQEVFGKRPENWNDDAMMVCDDCYNEMMGDPRSPALIKKAKELL